MKKLFICASVIGLVAGVAYWLCKKQKSNNTASKSINKKEDFVSKSQEEGSFQNSDVVEEMYQAKNGSAQDVYERHSEAGSIMKDAYSNIMEDFVEKFSGENDENEKDNNKEVITDNEAVSIMKELDLISDDLDDLLK